MSTPGAPPPFAATAAASGVPGRTEIEAAAARIAGQVRRTPVLHVEAGTFGPAAVLLKLELFQHTGSFKVRGVFNRLLSAAGAGGLPAAGAVTASGGNAGLALAYAARRLGVPAEVYVPRTASPVKVEGLRRLGARVRLVGEVYAEAYQACLAAAEGSGALFVHAYDQPAVVAGQGTLGLELAAQIAAAAAGAGRVIDPVIDTVLVAVGGGGLIAGIASALDPAVRIVAVEPAAIPTLHAALAAGAPVDVPVSGVAADSLGARRIGEIAFAVAAARPVSSVLVPDEAILDARRRLWQATRIAAEPGGATALAALTCGAYRPAAGERVAVVVCGGNTDPSDLAAAPAAPAGPG